MTSPDDQDPVRSKLDYAPPWVREQAVREQAAREQATREQVAHEPMPREPITRDQFRAALRQSGGPAVEQAAQNDRENRRFGDDRPWHQRALEPEPVPEPPAGVSNVWPMMLRLGVVCTIAAMVAAALVFLFSPKQNAHKIAQADASAPRKCLRRRRTGCDRIVPPRCTGPDRRNIGRRNISRRNHTAGAGTSRHRNAVAGCGRDTAAASRGTARHRAGKTANVSRGRGASATNCIPSRAELLASQYQVITGTGRERADTAPGRRQSGGLARSGPSRSAQRRQARSRARRK